MRFGEDPKLAPYLNRKDQRRLLAMVALLCLVVIGVAWAARPDSWYWLVPPDNETVQNDPVQNNQKSPSAVKKQPVDVGAIDASALTQRTDPAGSANTTAGKQESDQGKPATDTPLPESADLPAKWLEGISDQVMGLRVNESDTYYRVLAHISRLDNKFLKKHSQKDVLFVNLLRNPDLYRGKLITISGSARRITKMQVGKNKYGVKNAYEAWVLTPDSGSDPIRIVTTQIDPRLPLGEKVVVEVEATGYFLKLYSYASQAGQHQAPLILAARLQPSLVKTSIPSGTGLEPYILFFAIFIGISTVIAATIYSRGDRKFKQKLENDFPDLNVPSDKFLEQLENRDSDGSLFS